MQEAISLFSNQTYMSFFSFEFLVAIIQKLLSSPDQSNTEIRREISMIWHWRNISQ